MALFNDVVRLSFSVFCLLQSTSREKRRANNRVYSLTPITHIHADLINLKFIQSLDGQIRKDQEDWRRDPTVGRTREQGEEASPLQLLLLHFELLFRSSVQMSQ